MVMARRRRVRKRVCAIPRVRASDGSAFFKWYSIQCSFSMFCIFFVLMELNVCCSKNVVKHVGFLFLLPWLICIIVTPTIFNSKGYSESFPSELAQTFNVSSRANPFRLIAFLCNFPHSHSIPSLVLKLESAFFFTVSS